MSKQPPDEEARGDWLRRGEEMNFRRHTMSKRFGGSLFMPVLAVAGLALVGIGGYRMLSGDCSSGLCGTKVEAAHASHDGCALCPSDKTVAVEHVTSCESQSACATKSGCSEKSSCEARSECDIKDVCPAKSECEGKVCPMTGQTATPVALETPAETCKGLKDGCTGDGQNGCCGKCKSDPNSAACCKKTEGGQG